ncbi:SRPBCC domain-containing protein [Microlunatus ginsengisoli]|uniref:SRPBCC domain-containing protein n=1 Tax=Microlunatus ginsengisoli TaxID=363863 RepID=UPI0031DF5E6C
MSTEHDPGDLGRVIRDGGRTGLRFVRHYPHPIARVWRAITDSTQLRAWLPCDIVGERAQGAEIACEFWPAHVAKYSIPDPVLTGEIQVWEPPRIFQWTWGGDILRFELEPDAVSRTTLTFTTWLIETGAEGAANTAAGYHVCLTALDALLAGKPISITDSDDLVTQLEATYAVGTPGH